MNVRCVRPLALLLAAVALSGCSWFPGMASLSSDAELVQGPPIVDISTPFDQALECLQGKVGPQVAFAVGEVLDHTGKEQYTDGGTGKYVTQGAAEMVQTSLLRAGVTVLNRRHMGVAVDEVRWGLRPTPATQRSTYFISGSINSLDFLPGGGFTALVGGIGPRYRQTRILISLDMFLTDSTTSQIVASVPLQKQVFADELGFETYRFMGDSLFNLDAGMMRREALNFALRQMLGLATFELLAQRMNPRSYLPCRQRIDQMYGVVRHVGTGPVMEEVRRALEQLRKTDLASARILERELNGESIEQIMANPDAAPQTPAPAAPATPDVTPAPEPERGERPDPGGPTAPVERLPPGVRESYGRSGAGA